MNELKKAIYTYLKNHPYGLRIRFIASHFNTSNILVSQLLYEMKGEGKVYYKGMADFANREYYDLWFVK